MPKKQKAEPRTIRVLSVQQPFADQIVFGDKWCENRSWRTLYRGELYIHASRWSPNEPHESPGNGDIGMIIGKVEMADCIPVQAVCRFYNQKHGTKKKADSALTPEMEAYLEKWMAENSPPTTPEQIENLEIFSESEKWTAESFDHVVGEYCFILTNREPLAEPIKCGGKLNVWSFNLP